MHVIIWPICRRPVFAVPFGERIRRAGGSVACAPLPVEARRTSVAAGVASRTSAVPVLGVTWSYPSRWRMPWMVSSIISSMVLWPAASACWAATHGQSTMSPSTPSITVPPSPGAVRPWEAHDVGGAFEVHPTHVQLGDGIRVHEHDGQVGLCADPHLVHDPYAEVGKDFAVDLPGGFVRHFNAHSCVSLFLRRMFAG